MSLPSQHVELFAQVRHNLRGNRGSPHPLGPQPASHSPPTSRSSTGTLRGPTQHAARSTQRLFGMHLWVRDCHSSPVPLVGSWVLAVPRTVNEDPSLTKRRRLKQVAEARRWRQSTRPNGKEGRWPLKLKWILFTAPRRNRPRRHPDSRPPPPRTMREGTCVVFRALSLWQFVTNCPRK